jgi:tetratricopeptide (TPR) repeat protein
MSTGVGKKPLGRRHFLSVLLLGVCITVGVISLVVTTIYPQYHYRMAEQAVALRDGAAAQKHLAVCLKTWPASIPTRLLAARAARLAGSFDEAEQQLVDCRRLEGTSSETTRLEQSLLHVQLGDMGEEERLHRLVAEDHPETGFILEALAEGYRRTYRLPQALSCVQRWVEWQPDFVPALLKRAALLTELHHFPEAEEDDRRVLELDPNREEARLRLGLSLALYRQGTNQEATDHLEWFRQRHSDDPRVLFGLAVCRQDVGQFEEARQLLDRLLVIAPKHPAGLLKRGCVALDLKEIEDAERWLRQAVSERPLDYQSNFNLQRCLQLQGKMDEARVYEARARTLGADLNRLHELLNLPETLRDKAACYEIGRLFLATGDTEHAAYWLESVLREDPAHQPTHQLLADLYQQLGNAELSERHRLLAGPPP